ncbi:hypothetical protein LOTGIDRAFT_237778 [Lottia gigantea]|uniref:Apple domain-containing protein n=1 Tax=Lottia gigantea TaxID=225164 RepID=V4CLS7_LOTGI|nr:hypothetical protein LOTGIDRAFT_237778 [Lottia gigantea]ESP03265.1 hypothetical protein LOTGIDRAFT_237778 [Lottia gigantea]
MTVISNLMLVIVLLCVASLHVASPKPNLRTREAVDGENEDCFYIKRGRVLKYPLSNSAYTKSEGECRSLCQKSNNCTATWTRRYNFGADMTFLCILFSKPYKFVASNINLEGCVKLFISLRGSKTLSYYGRICHLFDIEYSNVPANNFEYDLGWIVEKKACSTSDTVRYLPLNLAREMIEQ